MTSPLINRFEKLIKRDAPQWLSTLSDGAEPEELASYRGIFPSPDIPGVETWLELLAWHNGTSEFGYLWEGNEFLSTQSSISLKKTMDELEANGTFDRWAPNEWWNPAWVPIFDDRSYNTYAIDTIGCYGGQAGQIISWSKDSSFRSAIAPSFEAWLRAFCDLLEARTIAWDEDNGGFIGNDHQLFSEILETRFEGFPLHGEARTRLSLGMTRVPKPPTSVTQTEGNSIELTSQSWAPQERSVQCLTWCGEHGVLVGQNAFDDPTPSFSLVDPHTGEQQHTVHQGDGGMLASWLPDRDLIAYLINGIGREIWTYDLNTHTRTPLLTGLWETRMHDSFSAGGQYIVHGAEHIRLFDLERDGAITIVPVEPHDRISAAISRDGKCLATHRPNEPIRLFETATMTCTSEFKVDTEHFSKLYFSPDNARLFGIGYYSRSFEQWMVDGTPVPVEDKLYSPFVLAMDQAFYVTTGYSGRVEVRNTAGAIIYSDDAHQHARVYGLTIDPINRTIISGGDDGQLAVRHIHALAQDN